MNARTQLHILLLVATTSLQSMDTIEFVCNKVVQAIKKVKEEADIAVHNFMMKHNEGYAFECNRYNALRVIPFDLLKYHYMHNDADKISYEHIAELKQILIEKNQKKAANIDDLRNCIISYNDIYTKQKNDANNIYFLDTILPILFDGHDFSKSEPELPSYMHKERPQEVLIVAACNPYLMSSLLYKHGMPVKTFDAYGYKGHVRGLFIPYFMSNINGNTFILNGESLKGSVASNRVKYLKAILTIPASSIAQLHKNMLPVITELMLCFHRLKQQNPVSFNVPKRVIKACILPHVVQESLSQEQCTKVVSEIRDHVQHLRKSKYADEIEFNREENKFAEDVVTHFLYNDFDQWADENMDVARVTYALLMKDKNSL